MHAVAQHSRLYHFLPFDHHFNSSRHPEQKMFSNQETSLHSLSALDMPSIITFDKGNSHSTVERYGFHLTILAHLHLMDDLEDSSKNLRGLMKRTGISQFCTHSRTCVHDKLSFVIV